MKGNKILLAICIVIPLLVGGLAAFLTKDAMGTFEMVKQPPLSPPAWLFPVVWTILYTLMGISSYLIINSGAEQMEISSAIQVYAWQLLVNFLWPTFFFNFQWYLFSFLWLVLLWLLVFLMIWRFKDISRTAAIMNIPYLLWLTFAGYLNFAIWLLNR